MVGIDIKIKELVCISGFIEDWMCKNFKQKKNYFLHLINK